MSKNKGLTVHDLEAPEFWERLNPNLTISDNPFREDRPQYPYDKNKVQEHVRQVIKEGYLQTEPVIDDELTSKLAGAVKRIYRLGLPAPFCFVYDEFWQLLDRLSNILTPVLGENYQFIPDFWAWHVPKNDTAAGWSPHRDHQYKRHTLREDGKPLVLTLWIPLTDVSPLNACMYVLPLHLDPNYPDNIDNQTVAPEHLQSIRALPVKAGSILAWNTYIIHWGSRSSEWASGPRISIGIYYQSGDVSPFEDITMRFPCPVPFEFRLGVIGRSILMYNKNYLSDTLNFSHSLLGLCDKYATKLDLKG